MLMGDRREPPSYLAYVDRSVELPRGDYLILQDDGAAKYVAGLDLELYGDVLGPHLLFERKKVSDFWQSLKQNRLNLQVMGGGIDGLLIEFSFLPSDIDWKGVYDAINGVAHKAPVYYIRNPLHLFETLRRYEGQLKDGTWSQVRILPQVKDLSDPRMAVLMGFPSIGEVRAEAILHHFGSLGSALDHWQEWDQVDGLGPKAVAKMREFLDRRWKDGTG